MKHIRFNLVECACGSTMTRLVSSDEGVDVYACDECGDFFENDSFTPHEKRKVRKERDRFDDNGDN